MSLLNYFFDEWSVFGGDRSLESVVDTLLIQNLPFVDSGSWQAMAIIFFLQGVTILSFTLMNTVAMIYVERKVLGRLMDRRGPSHVGPFGLLQNFADGIKLFLKEVVYSREADRPGMFWSWAVFVSSTVMVLTVVPVSPGFSIGTTPGIEWSLLLALAFFAGAPFAIVIAGWSQNNKYSLIGGMRSAAQMMSYEVPLLLAALGVVLMAGTANIGEIVAAQSSFGMWYAVPQLIGFIVFFVAMIAEVERVPFDLPEAEAELIEGWTTEYSGIYFALIMAVGYIRGFLGIALIVLLFLGGWTAPGIALFLPAEAWFFIKVYLVWFVWVWARGSLPRVRTDQILGIGWKVLLPLALLNLVLVVFWTELGVLGTRIDWAALQSDPVTWIAGGIAALLLLIGAVVISLRRSGRAA